MELRWGISLLAALFCSACCAAMYLFQQWDRYRELMPVRGSIIPGTNQKFLYWQDFYCQRYGTVGIMLIWIGFMHLVRFQYLSFWEIVVYIAIALCDAIGFTYMILRKKNHKPDYGFPEAGQVSKSGIIHSIYHGLTISAVVMLMYHSTFIATSISLPPILALHGIILYIIIILQDIKAGHFALLKPVKKDEQTQG